MRLQKLERENKNPKPSAAIRELNTKIKRIELELEWVNERKMKYKQDHLDLEDDDDTAVLTLDFFSTSTTTDFKFQDCICVFASKEAIEIPESILEDQITPIKPVSALSEEQVEVMSAEREKKFEKPKRSYKKVERTIEDARTFTDEKKIRAKERILPPVHKTDNDYVFNLSITSSSFSLSGSFSILLPLHRGQETRRHLSHSNARLSRFLLDAAFETRPSPKIQVWHFRARCST